MLAHCYAFNMDSLRPPAGALLRSWRNRRRLSQLDLALEVGMSARHLSFIETGRARPSREMLLRLADCLEIPPRPCNEVLLAAGYAPRFAERALADPDMQSLGASIQLLLDAHDPYPALAVDGKWNLVFANEAVAPLLAGVSPKLLAPPVNVLRLSLHPEGMAPHIENLPEWRANVLLRLQRQAEASADEYLHDLLWELTNYPCPGDTPDGTNAAAPSPIATPLRLRTESGTLAFLSTTMVFDYPLEINVSELLIEVFLPADAATAAALARIAVRA